MDCTYPSIHKHRDAKTRSLLQMEPSPLAKEASASRRPGRRSTSVDRHRALPSSGSSLRKNQGLTWFVRVSPLPLSPCPLACPKMFCRVALLLPLIGSVLAYPYGVCEGGHGLIAGANDPGDHALCARTAKVTPSSKATSSKGPSKKVWARIFNPLFSGSLNLLGGFFFFFFLFPLARRLLPLLGRHQR